MSLDRHFVLWTMNDYPNPALDRTGRKLGWPSFNLRAASRPPYTLGGS